MKRYPFMQVDAFTDRALAGNPCAIVFDCDDMSAETMQPIALMPAQYLALRARGGFFSPHVFCLRGATSAGDAFARHFGTPPDTSADPFTGSATGNMGAFLWRYG